MPLINLGAILAKWQVQLIILFIHIFLGLVGLYTFVFNYQISENILYQDVQDKQAIIAKSGAKSVQNFVENIENQLYSFVFSFQKTDENAVLDKEATRKGLADYILRSKPPVSGIAFYDDAGKLLIIENKQKIKLGENEDFSDSEVIKWSKDPSSRNKVYIANPAISKTGSTKGKAIMTLATPIYFGDKFKGTLTIRFLVNQFRDAFINSLTLDVDEDSYIVDSAGVLIAGDDRLINQDLASYANEQKWAGYEDFVDKFRSSLKKNDTKTSWSFKSPDGKVKDLVVAVSKIDLPNTDKDLYLVVTSSRDNTLKALSPLRYYGSVWAGLSLLVTLIGGTLFIVVRRLSVRKKVIEDSL